MKKAIESHAIAAFMPEDEVERSLRMVAALPQWSAWVVTRSLKDQSRRRVFGRGTIGSDRRTYCRNRPALCGARGDMAAKEPFDINEVFRRLRVAVAGVPKAAMFDLRDQGYSSPFEQLVGSLISARTRDETTKAICIRLFAVARTPEAMAALDETRLVGLLHGASFPEPKARDLIRLSKQIVEEHGGVVPNTLEGLTAFRGVGPKIAALTLAVGYGQPAIAVDVHVHRVVNRWGYVATTTPEQTMAALTEVLPQRYWIEINERLVPFGKSICTGIRPRCSECLLASMCRQVGVSAHR